MFASTSAMVALGQEIDPSITTIDELVERAVAGDAAGRQILIAGGAALGRAIAILLNLLSPALVVIGGRATASQLYTEQARQTASVESLAQPFRSARIITSDIELTSGAQGAATLILNELFTLLPPATATRRSARQSRASLVSFTETGGK